MLELVLGAVLEASWSGLGAILGGCWEAKMRPRWFKMTQDAAKIAQDGARTCQDVNKTRQDGAKTVQDVAKRGQDGAKTAKEGPR